MGVGKTVQILTFLAWCIESGKFPGLSESEPPFQPILIVAPLILVDTRTWEKEMEKFFANEGVIFWPVLSLRGDQLAKLRLDDVAGREIEIGTPILDLNRIQRHKVVITNYETIKSYQHSFAFVKDGTPLWSSRSSVRSPREALHSRLCGGAGSLRLDDVAGREIEIGTPILDLNRIQRHKVVITNYETKKTVGRISFIARNALTQFDRPSLLAGGSMCEKPGGDELVRG